MKPRRKIHEIDHTNDIKYRGPLNYQQFRMAAWVFIALSQIPVILSFSQKLPGDVQQETDLIRTILTILGHVATPLLLITNFSEILTSRSGYKKLLIKYGALSAGAILLFLLVYERYVIGLLSAASSRSEAHEMLNEIFASEGFLAFNIFLDLFLCTLVMFFLDYTPQKRFQGKAHYVFRLFVLIPILYEAAIIVLKVLAGLQIIKLPPELFPLLTTKPPLAFAVFVVLALFIKRRERKFIKSGKTKEEYRTFLETNTNSWHFSVHAAVIMVVAVIVDLAVLVAFAMIHAAPYEGAQVYDTYLAEGLDVMLKCGFGGSISLILVAPFMLLYSYNRQPKNPKFDRFIPIAGVVMLVIVYIEGFFHVICDKLAG